MPGTGLATFAPNMNITRSMIVTILYRLEGQLTVSGNAPFSDVKRGSYYEQVVI